MLCGCNAEKTVEDEREQGNSSPESSASQEETTTTTQEILTTPSVSDTVADDEQLQTDLTNFVSIFTEHDLEITDMQVIKRQTTVEDKVDIVYVSGSAENDIALYNFDYKMTYNLYNEGWILDEVNKEGSSAMPKKGPSDNMIQQYAEHNVSMSASDHDSYEIGENYTELSNGISVVDIKYTDNYKAGQRTTTYRHIYKFNSSKMDWEWDDIKYMHKEERYYLEGVWEGEDYSVKVTMPDNTDLSSISVVITDLRSNEVVYDGYTKEGMFDRYANFLNRNKPHTDPITGLTPIYATTNDHENIYFSNNGVSYEPYTYADIIQFTKVS